MRVADYLAETSAACTNAAIVDGAQVLAERLCGLRDEGGRVFVLGMGGSAANAAHVVNDLRKIARVRAYSPTDNVAEFSARANDEGLATAFVEWLKPEGLDCRDAVLVLSVGGGSRDASPNIAEAVEYAVECGADVWAIVGSDGGHARLRASVAICLDETPDQAQTPTVETMHLAIMHAVCCALRDDKEEVIRCANQSETAL